MGLVEIVSSDSLGGEVAAGVEHAPPHVALPLSRGVAGRRRRHWSGRRRRRLG